MTTNDAPIDSTGGPTWAENMETMRQDRIKTKQVNLNAHTTQSIEELIFRAKQVTTAVSNTNALQELGDVTKALLAERCLRAKCGCSLNPSETSLAALLAQPHTRNNHGHRTASDLTYSEIATLNYTDLRCLAQVLNGVVKMQAIEAARYKRDYYRAEGNYYHAMRDRAEQELKLAERENTGERTDVEP